MEQYCSKEKNILLLYSNQMHTCHVGTLMPG